MTVLRSTLLTDHGFIHGFSTRAGGAGEPPFESLNLGRGLGDPAATVARNHEIFRQAVGYQTPLFEVSQVHGDLIVEVDATRDVREVRAIEADALIGTGAVTIGVRVADCTPILLGCTRTGAVAAVHAGWRGVENEILLSTIDALCAKTGSTPAMLVGAIGPHIRVANFEVGEDVAERLATVAARVGVTDVIRSRPDARPTVDLTRIVIGQLTNRGVRHDDVGGHTFAEPERFFSYRRDGLTGRLLAVISAAAVGTEHAP